MQVTHTTLKDRHRAIRDGMPEALSLRIHRSLSWLQRAAQWMTQMGVLSFCGLRSMPPTPKKFHAAYTCHSKKAFTTFCTSCTR